MLMASLHPSWKEDMKELTVWILGQLLIHHVLNTLFYVRKSCGSQARRCNHSIYICFTLSVNVANYEALCRLDVLDLQDHPVGDQDPVFQEFKEQLTRNPEGWYETGLLWKGNHPPLPDNKHGSLKRQGNLVRKLEKQPGMLQIIYLKEQSNECTANHKGRSFTSRVRPRFERPRRARRFESFTTRLPEEMWKHHLLMTAWRYN